MSKQGYRGFAPGFSSLKNFFLLRSFYHTPGNGVKRVFLASLAFAKASNHAGLSYEIESRKKGQ
jgi:hypothetical protein